LTNIKGSLGAARRTIAARVGAQSTFGITLAACRAAAQATLDSSGLQAHGAGFDRMKAAGRRYFQDEWCGYPL
jgi:hypothetical protein